MSSVYDALVSAFNYSSPIHVDEACAKGHGFPGRVMHGAIWLGCRQDISGGSPVYESRTAGMKPFDEHGPESR